jgi:hypothetical protein
MALSESAVSELLEAFRTGEGVDLIRESVGWSLTRLPGHARCGDHAAVTAVV